MPNIWVWPINFAVAPRRCSPTRPAKNGTTCISRARRRPSRPAWEVINSIFLNKAEIKNPQLTAGAWAEAYEAVEQFNEPGVFTTLHGFEWTSAPEGNNLHRTVIFRDGVDRVKQIIPFSSFDSQDPEDLWKYMDRYEKLTGGQVLAIPHNGNLSNGLMFTAETY